MNANARTSSMVLGLALIALGSFGCASMGAPKGVAYRPAEVGPVHFSTKDIESVKVLLDSKPEKPFVEAGVFEMQSASNPVSIEAIRQRAAEAGLDGIYWIDCTSPCSGRCTAKGFKYAEGTETIASR